MNSVFLSGRLAKDPELRRTGSGNSVARFTIAVSNRYTNPDGTRGASFFDCVCYDKLAETIIKNVEKGEKITVEGRLEEHKFERKDGTKGSVTEVLVRGAEFQLKLNGLDFDKEPEEQPKEPAKKTVKKSKKKSKKSENLDLPDEDLPF